MIPARTLRDVAPGPQRTCAHCAEREEMIATAAANYQSLRGLVEKLHAALRRESHNMDQRAQHDARNLIERHDAGFLERSRERNRR